MIRSILALLCAAGIGACAADGSPQRAPSANPASEMAPPGQDPGRVVGSTAEEDCRFAVASEVGVGQEVVSVMSSSMGENYTTVLVDVPNAQAPWACEWGGNGVSRVYFTGSEGAM